MGKRKKKSDFQECVDEKLKKPKSLKRRPGSKYKTKEEIARAICYTIGVKKYGKKEMARRAAAGRKKSKGREGREQIGEREIRSESIHMADSLSHLPRSARRRVIGEILMDSAVHAGWAGSPPEEFLDFVALVLSDGSPSEMTEALHSLKRTGNFERDACAQQLKRVCSAAWKALSREEDATDLEACLQDLSIAALELGRNCSPC